MLVSDVKKLIGQQVYWKEWIDKRKGYFRTHKGMVEEVVRNQVRVSGDLYDIAEIELKPKR